MSMITAGITIRIMIRITIIQLTPHRCKYDSMTLTYITY
jgi:hypothetical protein